MAKRKKVQVEEIVEQPIEQKTIEAPEVIKEEVKEVVEEVINEEPVKEEPKVEIKRAQEETKPNIEAENISPVRKNDTMTGEYFSNLCGTF